ncbi:hypothetical protein [Paraburkholderia tagetis]|uniref:Uncharacterized protein n=1 Tax=Paraburkholderia tagetis TaxID=2913261 RepID=A0A9X1RJ51_9BURK|nr:hypothetical protein [Paraburkholderia tagetis]MCG5072223.1 hypothetical protein [Paraburkholderia tagetis]
MQFDMFAEAPVEAPVATVGQTHADRIAALPEVLRPRCDPAAPMPTKQPELDAWTRETQRIYLLYLVGAIKCITYRESSLANIRYVLLKLNGLGGEW